MPLPEGPHLDRLLEAIALEADAQRGLLRGDEDRRAVADGFAAAAERYRVSWELAPPASYGRLVGMLKAAVIGGDALEAAACARMEIDPSAASSSPVAAYALAIAALVVHDDAGAVEAAGGMRTDSPAFGRAADAIAALATGDRDGYARAVRAIVADFEVREEHLTGVAIADTAVMLERLAAPRGMEARPESPVMPPAPVTPPG